MSKLEEDLLSINVAAGHYESQTRFNALNEARQGILNNVVGMLRLTKDLAVRVEESGSATEAYNAYTRVLEAYRTLNMPADYEMRNILIRMAGLLWTLGDDYRAQSHAWQALGLRGHLQRAQDSDPSVLKDIAQSLLRTSPEISQLIQSEMVGHMPCNCN